MAADVGDVLADLGFPLMDGNPLDCENKVGEPSLQPVTHACSPPSCICRFTSTSLSTSAGPGSLALSSRPGSVGRLPPPPMRFPNGGRGHAVLARPNARYQSIVELSSWHDKVGMPIMLGPRVEPLGDNGHRLGVDLDVLGPDHAADPLGLVVPGCFLRAKGDIIFAQLCQRALGVKFPLLCQLDALTVMSWHVSLRLFMAFRFSRP